MPLLTDFYYDLAVESSLGQVRIDLERDTNWLTLHREILDHAERISLLPREGTGLPVVTVALEPHMRWVYFSRVYGSLNTALQIRLYAIGWQMTLNGTNITSLTWVYPTGTVEQASEPAYWKVILGMK